MAPAHGNNSVSFNSAAACMHATCVLGAVSQQQQQQQQQQQGMHTGESPSRTPSSERVNPTTVGDVDRLRGDFFKVMEEMYNKMDMLVRENAELHGMIEVSACVRG
jgi:hypothetical protein